jgi:hypothetical protein
MSSSDRVIHYSPQAPDSLSITYDSQDFNGGILTCLQMGINFIRLLIVLDVDIWVFCLLTQQFLFLCLQDTFCGKLELWEVFFLHLLCNFTSHSILIKAPDVSLYRWPTQRNCKLNHTCITKSKNFLLPLLLTHQGRSKICSHHTYQKSNMMVQLANNLTVYSDVLCLCLQLTTFIIKSLLPVTSWLL